MAQWSEGRVRWRLGRTEPNRPEWGKELETKDKKKIDCCRIKGRGSVSVMQGNIFLMKYREHLVISVLKYGADAACTLSHVLRTFFSLAI